MYENNEDDWKILKEFKQSKRNAISEQKKDLEKKAKQFAAEKTKTEQELANLNTLIVEQRANPNGQSATLILANMSQAEKKQCYLTDLIDDIAKEKELSAGCKSEISQLNGEIKKIDAEIKKIRNQKHQQKAKKKKRKQKQSPVQKCPKKCRISDISITCSHSERGYSLPVPPLEGDVPTLHVLSSSSKGGHEVLDVKFGGSCDHGKSQSAPDSAKHEIKERLAGNDQYCPRAKVVNADTNTRVDRPNVMKFAAPTKPIEKNQYPLGFIINNLMFGTDNEQTTFDLEFPSCKGNLPYQAKVIAHPECAWNFEMSFGYKNTLDVMRAELKHGTKGKVKNYNGVKSSGGWEAILKYGYKYDIHSIENEHKLSFEELKSAISSSWPLLDTLTNFFDPINGFFENALAHSVEAPDSYENKIKKAEKRNRVNKKADLAKVEILWPTVKLKGSYTRSELKGSPEIGGVGSLVLSFDPLFGIVGKIDIIQMLLMTLGAPLGPFLRKVSKMSVGSKDATGELDKTQSYLETNLALALTAKASVSGGVGFDCTEQDGWNISEKNSGVGGFIGFELAGEAKVEGMSWSIKFAAGAEFKTTDESGGKSSGIEIDYKPVRIGENFQMVGSMVFNGMAIVWVVYRNGGVDGGEKIKTGNRSSNAFGSKKESKTTEKTERKALLFSKRELFSSSDTVDINA